MYDYEFFVSFGNQTSIVFPSTIATEKNATLSSPVTSFRHQPTAPNNDKVPSPNRGQFSNVVTWPRLLKIRGRCMVERSKQHEAITITADLPRGLRKRTERLRGTWRRNRFFFKHLRKSFKRKLRNRRGNDRSIGVE